MGWFEFNKLNLIEPKSDITQIVFVFRTYPCYHNLFIYFKKISLKVMVGQKLVQMNI